MSIPLTINGATFNYPQNFDEGWGIDATGWAQAVTSGALYLTGGNFPLTAQVNFGTSFGMKVLSVTSETVNPASLGYLRLAKSDSIVWRNNANNGNLLLAVNGSDALTFNGSVLGLVSLTNNQIFVGNASNVPTAVAMSGDATIVASGAVTIANGAITNAKVASGAAIALTKLAAQTASRVAEFDASGLLVPASTTNTQLGYLDNVTSDIQTQIGGLLPLTGGTLSGPLSMGSHKITALAQGSSIGEAISFPVNTAQLSAGSVTSSILGAGAVGATNIASGAVSGSTSNSGSQQQIAQGTIGTIDLRAGAVSQSVAASSTIIGSQANSIGSVSLTTTGGAVIVFASASIQASTGGSASTITIAVTNGSSGVAGGSAATAYEAGTTELRTISCTALDPTGAGAHTYNFTFGATNSPSTAVIRWSLVAIELKK